MLSKRLVSFVGAAGHLFLLTTYFLTSPFTHFAAVLTTSVLLMCKFEVCCQSFSLGRRTVQGTTILKRPKPPFLWNHQHQRKEAYLCGSPLHREFWIWKFLILLLQIHLIPLSFVHSFIIHRPLPIIAALHLGFLHFQLPKEVQGLGCMTSHCGESVCHRRPWGLQWL